MTSRHYLPELDKKEIQDKFFEAVSFKQRRIDNAITAYLNKRQYTRIQAETGLNFAK